MYGNQLQNWVRQHSDEFWAEGFKPFQVVSRARKDLGCDITPGMISSTIQSLGNEILWQGEAGKTLDEDRRDYTAKQWQLLERLLRNNRELFDGKGPRWVTRHLFERGHRFSVHNVAEMMRLLKIA